MVDYFKSLFRFRLVDRPLRPLLYAAGTAAIAAVLYYAYKSHKNSTREAGYTTIYEEKSAPMKGSSSDPSLKSLEDSLAEAQRRNEQAVEKITQLELTNNFLLSKLIAVQQELSERGIKCKGLPRVSLAEAEQKYSEAMESSAQLEDEKTELMSQVNTLRGSVQQLEEELSEIRARCDVLKLLLSQAEMNYDQAMLSNARLESEKSHLMSKVDELEVSMQEMSNKLSEMHNKCVEATNFRSVSKKITTLDFLTNNLNSSSLTLVIPAYASNRIIKLADDTTLVGLFRGNNETAYREEIQHLVVWCEDNNLELTTKKMR